MRAVLADDSALFREGTAMVLTRAGIDVVGTAATAEELIALVTDHQPEVAVIDIRMPPTLTTEGIDAALQIKRLHPSTGVLLLSAHIMARQAMELVDEAAAGVGYLLKDRVSDLRTFVADVRTVAAGGTVVDPEIIGELLGSPDEFRRGLGQLTRRETEVLGLMAQGKSNAAIAEDLCVSARTVEANINGIFTKLELLPDDGTNRRVVAVLRYLHDN